MQSSMLWSEQYAPSKFSDFAGNSDAVSKVRHFALEWGRGSRQKPICLFGPPGIGKTTLAKIAASEAGWEPLIFSPSESADAEKWKKTISSALSGSSLFGAAPMVILESADSWSSAGSRGAVSALSSLLRNVACPVIITASDWYDRSMMPLRYLADPVPMKPVNASDIEKALVKIAVQANAKIPPEFITAIARSCNGDIRAAINDLQGGNANASREKERAVFEIVRAALRSTNYKAAKSVGFGPLSDRDTIKLYVLENLPAEFPDVADRARAFSALSRADVFDGRIMRRQYWGYLRYSSDLALWGVASERLHPGAAFVPYAYPSYIQKMGATKAKRAQLKSSSLKIASKLHVTTFRAKVFFPLIAAQADAESLSLYYGFEDEEVAALLGVAPESLSSKKPAAAKKQAAAKKPKTPAKGKKSVLSA